MSDFHTIKVAEIIKETDNCVTVLFDINEELTSDFDFTAGQYLTIKAIINGEDIRRAYSICTSPEESRIGVSVKKVIGGKMSNYLNENVAVGDELEVMKPSGKFALITLIDAQRDHYFFAAGSGITPIMSMIKALLENEPKSSAYLLYGNKDESNIIFDETLKRLQTDYEDQLYVEMTLSNPIKEKSTGLMGYLGKKSTSWQGQKGRIDSAKVAKFIQDFQPKSDNAEYYICGPGDMIETVRTTLMGNGILKENIHREYFSTATGGEVEIVNAAGGAQLKATLKGQQISLNIEGGKSILDTLLDAGHEAPYSCTSGACSTCMAKVVKGTVEMEACYALDEEEVEEGYILTCQAHPTSNEIDIIFEE